MSAISVVLGRDGMGDKATEADFEAYVAYVSERITGATGFDVRIEMRGKRDVQTNVVWGENADTVRDALQSLWDQFCADYAASDAREAVS